MNEATDQRAQLTLTGPTPLYSVKSTTSSVENCREIFTKQLASTISGHSQQLAPRYLNN